jgi:uncharacterized protein (DUF111 family)
MRIKSVGYGAGRKDFDGFANVLKIVSGELTHQFLQDTVQIIETNVDDVSGEAIGQMIDKLVTKGAKDVTVSSAITKKGRPTNLISVICDSSDLNNLIDTLVSETGTLGVRLRTSNRYVIPRVIISIPVIIGSKNFTVRCKVVKHNEVVKYFKVEAEDVKSVADLLGLSFRDSIELITAEVKQKIHLK